MELSELEFPKRPLDALLALDEPGEFDPDYGGFGHAFAEAIELRGRYGRPRRVLDAWVCAFHRSDDQSESSPGTMDLEFEVGDQSLIVELEMFVKDFLLPLARNVLQHAKPRAIVVALCNPDAMDLKPVFASLAQALKLPLWWATGDVVSAYEGADVAPILEAKRWQVLSE